jgi:hypothetical protein
VAGGKWRAVVVEELMLRLWGRGVWGERGDDV